MNKNVFVVLISLLTFYSSAIAQSDSTEIPKNFKYGFELGTYLSLNNKIPFWQRSNQFGAVPQTGNSIYFRQVLESRKKASTDFFNTEYCFDLMTIVGDEAKIIVPEAFIKLNLGAIELGAGRIKNVLGLVDTTLSSGSITWSGNALPLPEVRVSIPDYKRLFVDWLAFKGHYSHAWFGEQGYVKKYYLHQKSLYGRIGSEESKIHFVAGVLHNVQWGGIPKYEISEEDSRFINGQFPSDWFTYSQVVFPYAAVVDTTSGYAGFETENRFGNHVSQIDIGVDFRIGESKIMLYKNNIIETGRTLGSLSNLDDGLYGFSFKNMKPEPIVNGFVFEFIHSVNQGSYNGFLARLLNKPLKDYGNNAFYFNHQQYRDGWSYENETIGSAFFVPDDELKLETSKGYGTFANSNRLKVWYAATSLNLNTIKVEAKASYSKNYGSIWFPVEPIYQLSTGFDFLIPMKSTNSFLNVNIGIDHGDLINDNYGINIAYQRFW